jgi:hypothetical protein
VKKILLSVFFLVSLTSGLTLELIGTIPSVYGNQDADVCKQGLLWIANDACDSVLCFYPGWNIQG